MKYLSKLFVAALVLVAVGAGCFGGGASEEVTGPWWVSVDLPEGWAMYANYSKNAPDPSTLTIDRTVTDVVVQSTTLPVVLPGKSAGSEVTNFVDKDFTYIRIFRYDVDLTKVPDDATDLGNGFYSTESDKGTTYYLKGQYGIYRFVVTQDGQDPSVAKDVIMTAKEVANVE